ncbi:MAG: rhodanese-like domain-containing protein [Novosphingobium sp.]|nr:rhodanese-like domain-containing protein [Novosphingobium sp.]
MRITTGLTASLALLLAAPAIADAGSSRANPQIDYPTFEQLVSNLGPVREAHRLTWPDFMQSSKGEAAILLDTRSASDFARGHLEGAVNLPFSEFTDAKLATVLGEDTSRPVYIYCNNNFRDNVAPVMTKRAPLALNIPTFINLHGYGYGNVWELADVVSIADPGVAWVSGA